LGNWEKKFNLEKQVEEYLVYRTRHECKILSKEELLDIIKYIFFWENNTFIILLSIYYKRHGGYVMIGVDNTILIFLFVMSWNKNKGQNGVQQGPKVEWKW